MAQLNHLKKQKKNFLNKICILRKQKLNVLHESRGNQSADEIIRIFQFFTNRLSLFHNFPSRYKIEASTICSQCREEFVLYFCCGSQELLKYSQSECWLHRRKFQQRKRALSTSRVCFGSICPKMHGKYALA